MTLTLIWLTTLINRKKFLDLTISILTHTRPNILSQPILLPKETFSTKLGRYCHKTLDPTLHKIFMDFQRATYRYVNTDPLWSLTNRGPWQRLEENVRDFAEKTRSNLEIYTGVTDSILRLQQRSGPTGWEQAFLQPGNIYEITLNLT